MADNPQDTNKLSKVTDEMLETFSDKKPKKEEAESSVIEDKNENPDKTVVEFDEDEVTEDKPKKVKDPKKGAFFLKGLGVILLIAFVGAAIFGIINR